MRNLTKEEIEAITNSIYDEITNQANEFYNVEINKAMETSDKDTSILLAKVIKITIEMQFIFCKSMIVEVLDKILNNPE